MWKGLSSIGIVVLMLGVMWKITQKPVAQETRNNNQETNKIEITDKDWVRGKKNAPVTVVEYGDFQCPSCRAYYPVLKELEEIYKENLRVVYREFPLTTIHQHAWEAAAAAESAGR